MFKFLILSLAMVCVHADGYGHSIDLAVKSRRRIEEIPTHSNQEGHSTYVDVPGVQLPVYFKFRSVSSPLYVSQEHSGSKGSYQKSSSRDGLHHLVHEVHKPILQEIREVIEPRRKVVQVIRPVEEEILTRVHKKSGYGGGDDDNGGGNGRSSYGGGNGGDDDDYGRSSSYGRSSGYERGNRGGYGGRGDRGYNRRGY